MTGTSCLSREEVEKVKAGAGLGMEEVDEGKGGVAAACSGRTRGETFHRRGLEIDWGGRYRDRLPMHLSSHWDIRTPVLLVTVSSQCSPTLHAWERPGGWTSLSSELASDMPCLARIKT